MKDRLNKILSHEILSPSKFADLIGVQRSSISHILSGRNNPSLDFLRKVLEQFPNISGDWLITGEGSMLKNDLKKSNFKFNTSSANEIKQPTTSLFNQVSKEVKVEPQLKDVKETPQTPINTIESTAPIPHITSLSGTKKVKKIILLYSDNTFEEFNPS